MFKFPFFQLGICWWCDMIKSCKNMYSFRPCRCSGIVFSAGDTCFHQTATLLHHSEYFWYLSTYYCKHLFTFTQFKYHMLWVFKVVLCISSTAASQSKTSHGNSRNRSLNASHTANTTAGLSDVLWRHVPCGRNLMLQVVHVVCCLRLPGTLERRRRRRRRRGGCETAFLDRVTLLSIWKETIDHRH